jgi:ankyrin repeat protein
MQSTAEDNIEHLLEAISFNQYERLDALLDKVDVNSKDRNGQTALHRASSCGRVKFVNHLLERGADVNIANIDGNTALHFAVSWNKPEIVEILIKAKANPDLKNCKGETPDQFAARVGNEKIQIAFPKNFLFKKIIEASQQRNVDKINDLIEANPGIDLNAIVTIGEWASAGFGIIRTVMAAKNNIDCIKYIQALIIKGAKVDLPDKDGTTPLLQASYSGDVNLVKFLLEYGKANIDLADNDGNTALHYAVKKGNLGVAKLLLEKGADVKVVNNEGKTPLQIISGEQTPRAEHLITAKLLLEKGADLEKIGKQSKLYPLLKILTKFTDDEIKVVANHLEDLKTISDKISDFIKGLQPSEKLIQDYGKDLASKLVKPEITKELNSDIISMILINLLPEEFKKRLGEDLASKLIKNLLEALSPETSPSAQSSQVNSKTEAPRSPSTETRAQGASQLAPESPRQNSV